MEKENLEERGLRYVKEEEQGKGSLMEKIDNIITERVAGAGGKRSTTPLTGRKQKKKNWLKYNQNLAAFFFIFSSVLLRLERSPA